MSSSINEEWRPVVGYEEYYELSNLGRVRSKDRLVQGRYSKVIRRGRILTPRADDGRYLRASLCIGNNHFHKMVHRLVADAFLDKPDGCDVVNHIDNNTFNNRASNLEWTTQKGNVAHAIKQERMGNKPVVRISPNGERKEYRSIKSAAEDVGLKNPCSISRVCLHRQRAITAAGYKWEFIDKEAV